MTSKEQKTLAVSGLVAGAAGMFFFPYLTGGALLVWGGYEGYKKWIKKKG